MKQEDENYIINIFEKDTPYLYLGAGFSREATKDGEEIFVGDQLRQYILSKIEVVDKEAFEYVKDKNLQEVCTTYKDMDENKYMEDLTQCFKGFSPADYHLNINDYKWKSIFTVNIDDVVENVFKKLNEKIDVFNKAENDQREVEKNQKLLKLHGDVNFPELGYVFTSAEYSKLLTLQNTDYRMISLIKAFNSNAFFVIGTEFSEPELDYFNALYQNEFCKFETVFVNPAPSYRLKRLVENHSNYHLIEATGRDFFNLIHNNKENLKSSYYSFKSLIKRNGFTDKKQIEKNNPIFSGYKSKLYFGETPSWIDVIEKYPVEYSFITKIAESIREEDVPLYILYGPLFSGKTTLMKQLFFMLSSDINNICLFNQENEVSYEKIKKIVNECGKSVNRILLFFEDCGEFYSVLRNVLNIDNRICIIISSYTKIHDRKKYSLTDIKRKEYLIPNSLDEKDVETIRNKICEKGLGGRFQNLPLEEWRKSIRIKENIVSAMYTITDNIRFVERARESYEAFSKKEKKLLVIASILYKLGLSGVKQEFLINSDIKISKEIINSLSDFLIFVDNLVRVKNNYFADAVLENLNEKEVIVNCIIEVCKSISNLVKEKRRDYVKNTYEYLTKYKYLSQELHLGNKDIEVIYKSLQPYYEKQSYYWLQLGILEQKEKMFEYALQHFKAAHMINPNSYAIQHAIARNFCKQAIETESRVQSNQLFEEGKQKFLELIDSREQNVSKSYSIHSLIFEAMNYYKKERKDISLEDDKIFMKLLNEAAKINESDTIISDLQIKYFAFKRHENIKFSGLYEEYEALIDE